MSQPSLAKTFVSGLFSLQGRMRRSDFWVSSIALFIAAALATITLNSIIRIISPDIPFRRLLIVVLLIQLLVAWPSFAITVKRGHDRGFTAMRTFWVNVVAHVVPIALIIAPPLLNILDGKPQWQGAFWVFAVLTLYMVFDYGVLEGEAGPNQFGPSPKGAIEV